MDAIQELIHRVDTVQVGIFTKMVRNTTDLTREAAEYSASVSRLEAERETVLAVFEHRQADKERMHKVALTILDKAIESGDSVLAQVALRALEIVR